MFMSSYTEMMPENLSYLRNELWWWWGGLYFIFIFFRLARLLQVCFGCAAALQGTTTTRSSCGFASHLQLTCLHTAPSTQSLVPAASSSAPLISVKKQLNPRWTLYLHTQRCCLSNPNLRMFFLTCKNMTLSVRNRGPCGQGPHSLIIAVILCCFYRLLPAAD